MKKFLTFAVTFAFTLALLFVLPSCGNAENGEKADNAALRLESAVREATPDLRK